MKTKILLNNDARNKILKGVNVIFEPLKLALGPQSGRALLYRTYGRGPRMTEDGHTIAQNIEPKDEYEKLVAETFKEGIAKTNEKAGDGTTTTGVISGRIINDVLKNLSGSELALGGSKKSVKKIANQLIELSKQVREKVKKKAVKIEKLEDLERIAIISLGNEEVGKKIAEIVWKVGVDGFVDVVEGYKGELETEVIEGARFPAKPGAKAFLNNAKRFEMVIEDAKVILTNYKLDNLEQFRGVMNKLVNTNKKIAILAPDFSNIVLTSCFQTMFEPRQGGGYNRTGIDLWPVKVPSLRTEQFEDLAVSFGATFIDKETGKKFENIEENDLGFVSKLVVKDVENKEDAIAIGGKGSIEKKQKIADKEYKVSSPVAERIKVLREQIKEERIDSHKKLLERRIASLASAIGVIRVGASTSAESSPLKLKIEDAQYACKSALEEGYVKGGGLCLKEIAEEMGDNLLTNAIKAPYEQIQTNNEEPLEIGEDVIDSAKVVRLSVEHAVSIAANMITIKIIVPQEEERNPYDAYEDIAKAIMIHNALWAKKEGIKMENILEMEKDYQDILDTEDDR